MARKFKRKREQTILYRKESMGSFIEKIAWDHKA